MLGEVGEGYLRLDIKILLDGISVRIASIEALGCEEPGKLWKIGAKPRRWEKLKSKCWGIPQHLSPIKIEDERR